jgi:hypothetical protein
MLEIPVGIIFSTISLKIIKEWKYLHNLLLVSIHLYLLHAVAGVLLRFK